jgi:tetratricopeptide (TPR) repeat protein
MFKTFSAALRLPAWLAIGAALVAVPAHAQFFKDAQLEAALRADKPGELARLARERATSAPTDPQTVLLHAVVALERDDAAPRKDALSRAEACLKAQPQAAECHYAQGAVLGVQAMSEGMLKAARSVGTIRDSLAQAALLEPAWFPARSALVMFYLEAPGMMGGSTSKAGELASSAPRPDQVKALQARVQLSDGKTDAALNALTPLTTSADAAIADDARQWAEQAAHKLLAEGQPAKAFAYFERAARERPGYAAGVYGMGRVKGEAGAFDEALKLFDQAAPLKGAEIYPIEFRRGQALEKLGRNDAAKVAYKRFVDAGKGRKSQLEDARKRLTELGA